MKKCQKITSKKQCLEPMWIKNVMPKALANKLKKEFPIKLKTNLTKHKLRLIQIIDMKIIVNNSEPLITSLIRDK